MKHVDFIDADMAQCTFGDDEIDERIRNCDHELELTPGLPRDFICCPKCGWWHFLRPGEFVNQEMRDKYQIIDRRTVQGA